MWLYRSLIKLLEQVCWPSLPTRKHAEEHIIYLPGLIPHTTHILYTYPAPRANPSHHSRLAHPTPRANPSHHSRLVLPLTLLPRLNPHTTHILYSSHHNFYTHLQCSLSHHWSYPYTHHLPYINTICTCTLLTLEQPLGMSQILLNSYLFVNPNNFL